MLRDSPRKAVSSKFQSGCYFTASRLDITDLFGRDGNTVAEQVVTF